MYSVSEQYKEAIQKLTRVTKIDGTIDLTDGNRIIITDNIIMAGTLNVDNACVNGQEFELGAVYMGQLKFTIYSDINRYSMYGAKINVNFNLKLEDGTFEKVPIGEFTIQEATRNGKAISITAYDNMMALEKDFGGLTTGTPWEMLNHICLSCEIECGNTEDEINQMSPKFDDGKIIPLKVKGDNSYQTHRDLLSDISMTLGGFATIDRNGKLIIKRFRTERVEIPKVHVKKMDIADYKVKYDGISALIGENLYTAGDDGIVLNLKNQLWDTGLDKQKQQIIDNIWDAIKYVIYVPIAMDYDGDPALDLGDELSVMINDYEEIRTIVMTNNITIKNTQKITAVGSNPLFMKAESKESKQYEQIRKEITNGFFNLENFESSKEYKITSEWTKIADLNVYTNQKVTAVLHGQAIIEDLVPDTIEILYEVNGVIKRFRPKQILAQEGFYIVDLYSPVELTDTTKENDVVVYIRGTIPNQTIAKIKENDVNVTVFGNILGGRTKEFTGYIEIQESMPQIYIGGLSSYNYNEGIEIKKT